jgi:hypothetical protein
MIDLRHRSGTTATRTSFPKKQFMKDTISRREIRNRLSAQQEMQQPQLSPCSQPVVSEAAFAAEVRLFDKARFFIGPVLQTTHLHMDWPKKPPLHPRLRRSRRLGIWQVARS